MTGSRSRRKTKQDGATVSSAELFVNTVSVGGVLVALAFWGYCLVDFTRTDEYEIRMFSKPVWIMLLIFMNIFGGLMWMYYGTPLRR